MSYLENMIADVVDLHSRCVAFTQFGAQEALETGRCGDQHYFMAVEYFSFHPVREHICIHE